MNEPDVPQEVVSRLLRYLSYPTEWAQGGLYPQELARVQLAEVLDDLGIGREAFASLPGDFVNDVGSEHFRAAAILYWLRRPRTPEINNALKVALQSDPDKPMGRAFLRELENQIP
jgi:hypothetical protein